MAIQIESTTPKECVIIATTNMEETRNPGTAHMTSCMRTECVKIVISTPTIEREENRKLKTTRQEVS